MGESPHPHLFPPSDTNREMWGNPPIHLSFLHLIPMERCWKNFLIQIPTFDNYVEMWPVEWIPPSTFFPTICHLVLKKLCRGNPPIHLPTIWYKCRDVTCGGNPHINLFFSPTDTDEENSRDMGGLLTLGLFSPSYSDGKLWGIAPSTSFPLFDFDSDIGKIPLSTFFSPI